MMFISKTHFDLVSRGSAIEFLFRKMVPYVCALWVYLSGFISYLISLVSRYIFRFHAEEGFQKDGLLQDDSNCSKALPEVFKFEDSDSDEPEEKDVPKFCFKFEYQISQEIKKAENEESIGSVLAESKTPTVSTTSKCQFLSGKDFCGFFEEPEVLSFTVNELYADSDYGSFSNKEIIDGGFLSEKDLPLNSVSESVDEEIVEKSSTDFHSKTGEAEPEIPAQEQLCDRENIHTEVEFLFDSYPESVGSTDEFPLEDMSIDPKDGFLSDKEFEKSTQTDIVMDFGEQNVEIIEKMENFEENHSQNSNSVSTETMDTYQSSSPESEFVHRGKGQILEKQPDFPTSGAIEDKGEISEEQPDFLNSGTAGIEYISESDIEEDEEEENTDEDFGLDEENEISGKIEEDNQEDMGTSSMTEPEEDENDLETLWEHQDLVEQLKLELKKVRATGLPTIFEESESPRFMEDLKPWKIDEKFMQEDRINELHKFYKSYRDRMRKFDILNYQKMYAMGFLQLKDPLESIPNRKYSSIPALTSILTNSFSLGKSQRSRVDPTVKFMEELQHDLEMVYVGHMCLSWEILHWQFEKSRELQKSDTYGFHRYNQVADEFQQFQVLLQRFMENEPFQGPRVQNYVKNRCLLRNLLQVPVIKEDSFKDRKKPIRGGKDTITIQMLTVIIKESMRIFWNFVRADKHETSMILKGCWRTHVELQNPADFVLLTELRSNVQKKEKKLKEILRTGNCIVKMFHKKQEEDRSNLILFFSQVDLKLASRVLNMSRLTSEQLMWCENKLDKINFVERKIDREPSFLLFPC